MYICTEYTQPLKHMYMHMDPLCAGVTHRLPGSLKTLSQSGATRRRDRKRSVGTTPPKTEPLAEFIHKSG